MLGIGTEFGFFIHAALSGIIVTVVYTCIRIFRRLIRHNLIVIAIEDFLFWLGTAIYLFIQMYHTSDGSIRWFFVLGVAAGMIFTTVLVHVIKKVLLNRSKRYKIDK